MQRPPYGQKAQLDLCLVENLSLAVGANWPAAWPSGDGRKRGLQVQKLGVVGLFPQKRKPQGGDVFVDHGFSHGKLVVFKIKVPLGTALLATARGQRCHYVATNRKH